MNINTATFPKIILMYFFSAHQFILGFNLAVHFIQGIISNFYITR
ncbi:hypothetical protein SAMN05920897_1302 [Alkalispirochaeta americana]|uniref:Uncharacterized protein n=1 Tax=Alkalispirochaeta americana TaxID=159291 RepID=A0A1N6XS14_9SPIO|nr:hypothetical protein SAMN05920897_1302 [Alkalispirochaeta americana]